MKPETQTYKHTERWSSLMNETQGYQREQSVVFGEKQFSQDSQRQNTTSFSNAFNPYAAALADVFGL